MIDSLKAYDACEYANQLREIILDEDDDIETFEILTSGGSAEPFGMLLLGSAIRCFARIRRKNRTINYLKKSYLGTMGFYKFCFPCCRIGKAPGEASGSESYIPITCIKIEELRNECMARGLFWEDGDLIEDKANQLASILSRNSSELLKLLTYLIREMLRNIPEHAETGEMWICAQYWKGSGIAEIAILDEGIGVFKSITKNPSHKQYIDTNQKALQWAVQAGISQALAPSSKQKINRPWANSGYGLYVSSRLCSKLKGSFIVASGRDFYELRESGPRLGKTFCPGTAIRMRLPIENIQKFDEMVRAINIDGENVAKDIRGAFKSSSLPSKGLMTKLDIHED